MKYIGYNSNYAKPKSNNEVHYIIDAQYNTNEYRIDIFNNQLFGQTSHILKVSLPQHSNTIRIPENIYDYSLVLVHNRLNTQIYVIESSSTPYYIDNDLNISVDEKPNNIDPILKLEAILHITHDGTNKPYWELEPKTDDDTLIKMKELYKNLNIVQFNLYNAINKQLRWIAASDTLRLYSINGLKNEFIYFTKIWASNQTNIRDKQIFDVLTQINITFTILKL